MSKNPLVSLIVPFYNTGDLAGKLVTCVLDQTYQNLEIILVNDGSTDGTLALLEDARKRDFRVVLINQKNSGSAAGARNAGLKKMTGEYVMFVDSDDEVDLRFVERMVEKIQATGSDLVTCGFKYHRLADGTTSEVFVNTAAKRRAGERLSAYVVRLLGNDGHLYSVVNKIFRADIIKENRLTFDVELNFGEDLTFVLAYLKYAEKISFLYEALYLYNYGTETSTVAASSLKIENWQQNWRFLKNWFEPEDCREEDVLNWVRYRWSYSYCLAICRSNKTMRQKHRLLKRAPKGKQLPQVGRIRHIGRGKYLQEVCYRMARVTPGGFYIFILLVAKINRLRV